MNKNRSVSYEVVSITLHAFFIGMLIAASYWILLPFLISTVWAAMIVVATWPILLGVQSRLRDKRGPAAAVMTVLLLLVIVVPFSLVIAHIAGRMDDIGSQIKSLMAFTVPPPGWLKNIPMVSFTERWQQFSSLRPEEVSARLFPYAMQIVGRFVSQAGGVGTIILNSC
jgi:predicted PurR-regulated permease PerM